MIYVRSPQREAAMIGIQTQASVVASSVLYRFTINLSYYKSIAYTYLFQISNPVQSEIIQSFIRCTNL